MNGCDQIGTRAGRSAAIALREWRMVMTPSQIR